MISFSFAPYSKRREPTTLHNARLTFSDDTFIDLQVPEWFAQLDLSNTDDIYDTITYLRPFTGRRDFKNLKSI